MAVYLVPDTLDSFFSDEYSWGGEKWLVRRV
jgi:hypothetical protein